ncbi:hypothetical protein RIF29_24878 [Crotalaria pallida]|uniref:Uncharacterized protein n=1 Tax=Crotalaria pallida TaxID=3830 RepID=A0AAN9EN07_CROPI
MTATAVDETATIAAPCTRAALMQDVAATTVQGVVVGVVGKENSASLFHQDHAASQGKPEENVWFCEDDNYVKEKLENASARKKRENEIVREKLEIGNFRERKEN